MATAVTRRADGLRREREMAYGQTKNHSRAGEVNGDATDQVTDAAGKRDRGAGAGHAYR